MGDFFNAVLGVLGAAFSGGATGLIGVALKLWFDHKKAQNDLAILQEQNRSAEKLVELENARSERHDQALEREALEERLGREAEADSESLQASYKLDQSTVLSDDLLRYCIEKSGWFFGWFLALSLGTVAVWRRGIRPALTTFLVIVTWRMYEEFMTLMENSGPVLSALEVHDLLLIIIQTIVYLTVTCTVWWYGVSQVRKDQTG